jgi:hypothetical protein
VEEHGSDDFAGNEPDNILVRKDGCLHGSLWKQDKRDA